MGTFTIKETLLLTNKHFHSRFGNRNRDVIKKIVIKERKIINKKDPSRPQIKFIIETFSYPQYAPYNRHIKNSKSTNQRKFRHSYDNILELDRLSINTKNWVYRLGSQRKWEEHPSQSSVQQLYKSTRESFKKKANRKGKTKKEQTEIYRELVQKHKKRAKYLDIGDYNSKVNGINGDFYFRDAWAYHVHDHLFGRQYGGLIPSKETNPASIPFFPKHAIHLIETLLERGKLKDD